MNELSVWVEAVLKVSLVLAVGLGVLALLRARSAALRHWILSLTIAAAMAAPIAPLVLPGWTINLSPAWLSRLAPEETDAAVSSPLAVTSAPPFVVGSRPRETAAGTTSRWSLLSRAWMAGTSVSLTLLALALFRMARLARRSRRLVAGPWTDIGANLAPSLGIRRRVRVLRSDHPTLLFTWGLLRPAIVLPQSADAWPEERVRVVLAHELAHVARLDWPIQITAELLRAVYWFNPLAWLACRRVRHESERAADDVVLCSGINGCDYATHLIELARELGSSGRDARPALAMAGPSGLERRVSAMVNERLDHTTASRRTRFWAALVSLTLVAPIVSARPAATNETASQSRVSGVVVDPMGRTMPGVRLVALRDGREALETRTDGDGRFEIIGLAEGEYLLQASLPGFRTQSLSGVSVGRSPVTVRFAMPVGSLAEQIHIKGSPQDAQAAPDPELGPRAPVRRGGTCVSSTSGGDIKEPRKVRDVRPIYPASLVPAGVTGVVVLEGVLTTEGDVAGIQVIETPDPELTEAALRAVRQWAYVPTLLNCEPVEVAIKITVDFSFER